MEKINSQSILYRIFSNGSAGPLNGFTKGTLDLSLALLFLPPALFAMGFIFILYKLSNQNKGPFLYKGERMGKDKKIFKMFKIRTLKLNTENDIGPDVLSPCNGRELRFGTFLRWTRLDELPQLFNVIKGDMSFVGPRPVRPNLYNKVKNNIPNYDNRFTVKAGLIGYAQLFTPHSAPKRMRSLFTNRYIKKNGNTFGDTTLILFTILSLSINLIKEIYLTSMDYLRILNNRGVTCNQRKIRRIRGKDNEIFLTNSSFQKTSKFHCRLLDINYKALSLGTSTKLELNKEIYLILEGKKDGKKKLAKCKGYIHYKRMGDVLGKNRWVYVIFYEPISDLNRYMVDQNILKQSIARCR